MGKFRLWTLRVLGILLILVALILTALLLIERRWGDRIVRSSIQYLNRYIDAPISISSASFSFFKQFPNAALHLTDVLVTVPIFSPFPPEDTLLMAQDLYVLFDPFALINKQFRLDRVIIRNGTLRLRTDNKGRHNFTILRERPNQPQDSLAHYDEQNHYSLNLEEIRLHDITVDYRNEQSDVEANVAIHELRAQYHYLASESRIRLALEANVPRLRQGDFVYLKDQKIEVTTDLHYAPPELTIGETLVAMDGNLLRVKGSYQTENQEIHVTLSGENMNLEPILGFATQYSVSLPQGYTVRGSVGLGLTIDGEIATGRSPRLALTFEGEGLTLRIPDHELRVKRIRGSFDNGDRASRATANLALDQCDITSGRSSLSLIGRMANLESPTIYISTRGDLQNNEFPLTPCGIKDYDAIQWSGEVLTTFPSLSDLNLRRATHLRGDLECTFRGVNASIQPFHLRELQGALTLKQRDLIKGAIVGLYDTVPMSLGVNVKNLAAYLDGQGDASWTITARIDDLNLSEALDKVKAHKKRTIEEKGSSADRSQIDVHYEADSVSLSDAATSLPVNPLRTFIDKTEALTFNGQFNGLIYRNLSVDSLALSAYSYQNMIRGTIDRASLLGGEVTGAVDLIINDTTSHVLQLKFNPRSIDLKRLFRDMDNFNQSVVRSENLSGRLSGQITAAFPTDLRPGDWERINAQADLVIDNGVLDSLEVLQSVGRFLGAREVEHIEFSTLTNRFTIRSGVLHIPRMQIRSSALDLTMEGKHAFDTRFEYRMRMKLSDVLFNRFRMQRRDLDQNAVPIEEVSNVGKIRPHGGWIFLLIRGDSTGTHVSYDGEALRGALQSRIQQEKEILRELYETDSPFQTKQDTSRPPQRQKPVFTIEWEEDSIAPKQKPKKG